MITARTPRTTPAAWLTLSWTPARTRDGRVVDPVDRAGDRLIDPLGLLATRAVTALTSARIASTFSRSGAICRVSRSRDERHDARVDQVAADAHADEQQRLENARRPP